MATFKSGKRGRPLELDIDKVYDEFFDLTPMAELRLRKFRQETKGIRGEAILGSQTSLPDWLDESIDLLQEAKAGRKISYREAKLIKLNLETIKELGSRQKRVYERALQEQLTSSYFDELLKYQETSSSEFTKQQINEIKTRIESLSKRAQQSLLFSKYYQSPKTIGGRYKKVLAWSKKDSGQKNMTLEEAWAYLLKRRIEDGLD